MTRLTGWWEVGPLELLSRVRLGFHGSWGRDGRRSLIPRLITALSSPVFPSRNLRRTLVCSRHRAECSLSTRISSTSPSVPRLARQPLRYLTQVGWLLPPLQ